MSVYNFLEKMGLVKNLSETSGGKISQYLHARMQGSSYIPIGQGNLYETNAYLCMIQQQNNLFYLLYLLERQYFTNIYRIEGCEELSKIWDAVTKSTFDYGRCAVKKMGDKYIPFSIANIKYKNYYEVESASGIVISPTNGFFDMEQMIKIPLNPEDTVFCKLNYNAYPALLFWQYALKTFMKYLQVNETNITWLAKHAVYTVKNGSSERIEDEVTSLVDISSPYAIINKGLKEADNEYGTNKLEVLPTPTNTQNEFWHSFRECQSWWYQHLGRRHNSSFKKERNVSSETEIAEACFDNLEYEMKKYLEMFVEDWNKKWGFNAKLVNIVEEKEQKEHADEEQDKKLFKQMEGKEHNENI